MAFLEKWFGSKSTDMHPALRVPQILRLICFAIRASTDAKLGKHGLTVWARTSTVTGKPALDLLWEAQDTISHLLNCMPAGIWNKDRVSSDWERPLVYMDRVRTLVCTDWSLHMPGDLPGLFEILRLSLPTPFLFPRLRSLHWIFSSTPTLSLVSLLLAPGITNIAIGSFDTIPHLTILAALSTKCPLLVDVKVIQPDKPAINQFQAVSCFVRELARVESLELASLEQRGFEHLGRLDSLQTLTVKSPTVSPVFLLPKYPAHSFRSLRFLVLKTAPLQSVLAFTRALSRSPFTFASSALEGLMIDVSPAPDASSLMQIYVALKKNLPRTSLTTLQITSRALPNLHRFPVEPPPITIATIQCLFHFTHLTSVILRPPTGIDLADNDILALANAWSQLEHLSLRSRSAAQPLRATLRSLFHLARFCPDLETLAMSIDASVVPELGNRYVRVRQSNFNEWEVADSRIGAPLAVARFLSELFPELFDIYTEMQSAASAALCGAKWGEVAEMLPVCHEMRGEEQYWACREERGWTRGRSASIELD
ncbi:hypothetical protein C8R46DRAFT_981703 [Mycena filopes]|nr:hypothetical protein C8R46DRAFT_981703 [Mycena filopes]